MTQCRSDFFYNVSNWKWERESQEVSNKGNLTRDFYCVDKADLRGKNRADREAELGEKERILMAVMFLAPTFLKAASLGNILLQ